jgi:hypothetical protein
MQSNLLITVILGAILIWQVALTVFFVKIFGHYRSLLKGIGDLKDSNILDINNRVRVLEKEGLSHIQNVGMVRFNPFNETGGDNSFTICLMDGNSNGIILTGLHTREKTRMYAKKIEQGKSKYELSKEEKKAIEAAINVKI